MITAAEVSSGNNVTGTAAADCLTVLLLDVLSALHDSAGRLQSQAEPSASGCSIVVEQLSHALSEAALHAGSHDLTPVRKKLAQMNDVL